MIPSVLACHVRQGIEDFLRTTFPTTTPFFHGMLDRFLDDEKGMFRGPYISVQLPFRNGAGGTDFFPEIPLRFKPYFHQEKAFRRLSGEKSRSTLVATGTGSGKTECFLYPILDYCRRHRGEPGIKAILIYPMNALASDQALRIAGLIYNTPALRGNVTAGLYVGDRDEEPALVMGPKTVITNKETLCLSPPDILLTNYKMLDYLLIRPRDTVLWAGNGPETLKYLVVDELHTFDGAQGTDLACLLRRLKARLHVKQEHLCCIGTSATLGSEEEQGSLRSYAGMIFGEIFDEQSIITESRLSAGEFLEQALISNMDIIPAHDAHRLIPGNFQGYEEYVRSQYELWTGEELDAKGFSDGTWRLRLAGWLKEHSFFQNLLKSLGGKSMEHAELIQRLLRVTKELGRGDRSYREHILWSMLTLVSEARDSDGKNPFLHVRIQLWMRELRRLVADVKAGPTLRLADDLTEAQRCRHLPLVHCLECGSTGWAGVRRSQESFVNPELSTFYHAFFARDARVVFLFPDDIEDAAFLLTGVFARFCGECLHLSIQNQDMTCSHCGHQSTIRVYVPETKMKSGDRMIGTHDCPYCNGRNSLMVMGSRAASLSSIAVTQLFTSVYNDDKKLIAFSDSVQDASHRAGFFGARSYRFSFRTALQQSIQSGGKGKSLMELSRHFVEHWRAEMDEPAFTATFIAHNMEWLSDYEHLVQKGALPKDSDLYDMVCKRISWEITSEFGFRSRIGRTLEKSGSSVATLVKKHIDESAEKLQLILGSEIGSLRDISRDQVKRFIIGFTTYLRHQGAIIHEGLLPYIEDGGNTYRITMIRWMPSFGRFMRSPAFIGDGKSTRFDRLLSGKRTTWYEAWAEKTLSTSVISIADECDRVFLSTLHVLVEAGILIELQAKGNKVWGLSPESLIVDTSVLQFRCRLCGHALSASAAEEALWQGASCLRFRCQGTYEREEAGRADYYGVLYSQGDVLRIVPQEHTGLLDRKVRDTIESVFKAKEHRPWEPNLLSCTPTLEMGIDIGDLSSVILCSVPPTQAQYIQRIGRAGRRDGNALAFTVAGARPHDLYFYANPVEMIEGVVQSPGVFLNASAVLERQFTAFCFDTWVACGISPSMLPNKLSFVLSNVKSKKQDKFPYTFIKFIENHGTELLESFIKIFSKACSSDPDAEISPESCEHLKRFLDGDGESSGSLRYQIMNGLISTLKEKEAFERQVGTLRERIKKKESNPVKDLNYEEELRLLRREKNGIQQLIQTLVEKNVFNFFTDEGLIPNYSFPEAGVTLHSIIYRKNEKTLAGKGTFETAAFDYVRPAAAAIAELAPSSTFYAGGRHVKVDQVEVSLSPVEQWRFCDNCDHSELIGVKEEQSSCLRCGSTMWSDKGQERPMIRLRQVFATSNDSMSRISDDDDDREPSFYNRAMMVDFDDVSITDAWHLTCEDLPFGFEFISKATFRDINFGERGEFGEKVKIAGTDITRRGFIICRYCGKVQTPGEAPEHTFTCKARKPKAEGNFTDCVYLYREFDSEAIRILLPVTTFSGSKDKLHSFIAALHLGLKKTFRGNIDHLQTMVCDEPVPGSPYRKQYLVLYDTVPGGTGYLKQLMLLSSPLLDVLHVAREHLASCSCVLDSDRDGCYSCLYAYRHSHEMKETSRSIAVALLTGILTHREHLAKIDTLRNVKMNSIIESELEARFIEALRRMKCGNKPVTITKELVNCKPGYLLTVSERAYYIEPQVHLGPADGVAIHSRADFLIRPARILNKVKPIAIFTDGYLYHRDRMGSDTAQRLAILRSGQFLVWSITWKDVESRFEILSDYFLNLASPGHLPMGATFSTFVQKMNLTGLSEAWKKDSLELLLMYLSDPREPAWQKYAWVLGCMHIDHQCFSLPEKRISWQERLNAVIPAHLAESFGDLEDTDLIGSFEAPENTGYGIHISVKSGKEALSSKEPEEMRFLLWFCDETEKREHSSFEYAWNGVLHSMNLFQFLPNALFVTQEGLREQSYDSITARPIEITGISAADSELEWTEFLEFTDSRLHELLSLLAREGAPMPEAGFELTDNEGTIVATAEIAWPELMKAILLENEYDSSLRFTESGWNVFRISEILDEPEEIVERLSITP